MAVDIVQVLSSHTWLVATRLDTQLRTFLSSHRVWWQVLIHNIGENEVAKRSTSQTTYRKSTGLPVRHPIAQVVLL